LDWHLVGGAADAAGLHLEDRGKRLDPGLELLDRVLAGPLGQDGHRVVDDLLGDRLLAVAHHLVDQLLNQAIPVDRIWLDRPNLSCCAARHATWPSRRTASAPSCG